MRKTKISYIVAIFLSILLTLSIILPSTAYAQEIENTSNEVKSYSNATIEEDFDESSVIIVLDNGAMSSKWTVF